ncbi:MAG: nuclear transport factor 2 family protein [Bacteroidota bacterium]
MTKITVKPDCGNAPRKAFLRDFNSAFAKGDAGFIIDHVSDDMLWIIHGDKTIKGKEAFANEINVMKDYVADELIIEHIITHGREASCNGVMKMGSKTYNFCDVYRFTNTTSLIIKEMYSYVIEGEV